VTTILHTDQYRVMWSASQKGCAPLIYEPH